MQSNNLSPRETFRNILLDRLYEDPNKYYHHVLSRIVEANNKLHNDGATEGNFKYKGVEYSHKSVSYAYYPLFDLHKELHAEMDRWLKEVQEISLERSKVKRAITVLLNECSAPGTLSALFGGTLYASVASVVLPPQLKEPELAYLQTKYASVVKLIKERVLSNMLLKSRYDHA